MGGLCVNARDMIGLGGGVMASGSLAAMISRKSVSVQTSWEFSLQGTGEFAMTP